MMLSRRDFMKLVGVSVASLSLTRCKFPVGVTCYAPLPPSPTATVPATARETLRKNWLSFGDLAQATITEGKRGLTENTFGQDLVLSHQKALDELVSMGEMSREVAELVQEAYEAATYHVWRSNTTMTCYEPMIVNYAPTSAGVLVRQTEILNEISSEGEVDQAIIEKARVALEQDMAFFALTESEVSALYDHLLSEWQAQQGIPEFEALDLEITPEAQTAAKFIIDLILNE